MKRWLLPLCLTLILALAACSGETSQASSPAIQPHPLTQGEQEVLNAYNITQGCLLSFQSPEQINSIQLKTYRLGSDGTWSPLDAPALGGGELGDRSPLSGTVSLLPQAGGIDVYFSTSMGGFSYRMDTPAPDAGMMHTWVYLTKSQTIVPREEIPVALFAYAKDGPMGSLSLEDFSHSTTLLGPDVVQAVTITFSEAGL